MKFNLSNNIQSLLKTPGRYTDGQGLQLFVRDSGSASWVFRYKRTIAGKQICRDMGLGSATGDGTSAPVSLRQAREMALEYRLRLSKGEDPAAAKKAARKAGTTLQQILDHYLANKPREDQWKADADGSYPHADKIRRTLDNHAARLLTMPVEAIDKQAVLSVLEKLSNQMKIREFVRGIIEQLLDWAQGYHDLRENVANPARSLGKVLAKPSKAEGDHHAAMNYRELPAFFGQLSQATGAAAQALAFTILTAVRSGETNGAVWSEIDMDAATWTIPAERMKASEKHVVPLSDEALAILRDRQKFVTEDGRVFPISPTAMKDKLTKSKAKGGFGLAGQATVHGMRSAFSDWAGNETSYDRETREFALAHAVENATEAAYRRERALDKRRPLMQDWASHLTGKQAGNVVSIRRAS